MSIKYLLAEIAKAAEADKQTLEKIRTDAVASFKERLKEKVNKKIEDIYVTDDYEDGKRTAYKLMIELIDETP